MATVSRAGLAIGRQSCTYTACYCEENVYHLLQRMIRQAGRPSSHLYVIFISNSRETVPFWMQTASQRRDGLVVWDYHVLVLQITRLSGETGEVLTWDLDTMLPFPCTFEQYAEHALQVHTTVLPPQFQRFYRLVSADNFLRRFASDRSHMLLADGSWSAPPPGYACIVAHDGCTNNLHYYRDMTVDLFRGVDSDSNLETAGNTSAGQHTPHSSSGQQGPAGKTRSNTSDSLGELNQASWHTISALAETQQYGVVVTEQQLLSALRLWCGLA